MSKSTYTQSLWSLNPHTSPSSLTNYPHKDSISFIVVTKYAPKSTYSPKLNNGIVEWSDRILSEAVDEMMGMADIVAFMEEGEEEGEEE